MLDTLVLKDDFGSAIELLTAVSAIWTRATGIVAA